MSKLCNIQHHPSPLVIACQSKHERSAQKFSPQAQTDETGTAVTCQVFIFAELQVYLKLSGKQVKVISLYLL